jgi:hypothetical protein
LLFYKPIKTEPFRFTNREPYKYLANLQCVKLLLQSNCSNEQDSRDLSNQLRNKFTNNSRKCINKQPERLKALLISLNKAKLENEQKPVFKTFLNAALLVFAFPDVQAEQKIKQFERCITLEKLACIDFCHSELCAKAYSLLFRQLIMIQTILPSCFTYRSNVNVTFSDSSSVLISDCGETTLRFLFEVIQTVYEKEKKQLKFTNLVEDFFKLSSYKQNRTDQVTHNMWARIVSSFAQQDTLLKYKIINLASGSTSLMPSLNNVLRMLLHFLNKPVPDVHLSPLEVIDHLNHSINEPFAEQQIRFEFKGTSDYANDSKSCILMKVFPDTKDEALFLLSVVPEHIWITPIYTIPASNDAEVQLANELLKQAVLNASNEEIVLLLFTYARHLDYSLNENIYYEWYDQLLIGLYMPCEAAIAEHLIRFLSSSKLDPKKIVIGNVFQAYASSLNDPFNIQLFLRALKARNIIGCSSIATCAKSLYGKLEDSQQGEFANYF